MYPWTKIHGEITWGENTTQAKICYQMWNARAKIPKENCEFSGKFKAYSIHWHKHNGKNRISDGKRDWWVFLQQLQLHVEAKKSHARTRWKAHWGAQISLQFLQQNHEVIPFFEKSQTKNMLWMNMKIYLNCPHFRSSGNFRVHMRSCSKTRKA